MVLMKVAFSNKSTLPWNALQNSLVMSLMEDSNYPMMELTGLDPPYEHAKPQPSAG